MRARCRIVERNVQDNIVFLQDLSGQYGSRTITNDAEAVVSYYCSIYGNRLRIVYLDTDGEWWEIVWGDHNLSETSVWWNNTPSSVSVEFKSWSGLAWDILSRKEPV
jgi:hypothetical protein